MVGSGFRTVLNPPPPKSKEKLIQSVVAMKFHTYILYNAFVKAPDDLWKIIILVRGSSPVIAVVFQSPMIETPPPVSDLLLCQHHDNVGMCETISEVSLQELTSRSIHLSGCRNSIWHLPRTLWARNLRLAH